MKRLMLAIVVLLCTATLAEAGFGGLLCLRWAMRTPIVRLRR